MLINVLSPDKRRTRGLVRVLFSLRGCGGRDLHRLLGLRGQEPAVRTPRQHACLRRALPFIRPVRSTCVVWSVDFPASLTGARASEVHMHRLLAVLLPPCRPQLASAPQPLSDSWPLRWSPGVPSHGVQG